jgi:hypothetical protein
VRVEIALSTRKYEGPIWKRMSILKDPGLRKIFAFHGVLNLAWKIPGMTDDEKLGAILVQHRF